MAFDRNDPVDLLTLKTEVTVDVLGMGYALVSGNTQKILGLLNDPALNVGGETTGETFTGRLILDVIEPDDLTPGAKFSEGEANWLKLLMEATETMDDDLTEFETKFRGIFSENPTPQTITNLNARVRTLSRAEVLFGEDTVISRDDWIAARES